MTSEKVKAIAYEVLTSTDVSDQGVVVGVKLMTDAVIRALEEERKTIEEIKELAAMPFTIMAREDDDHDLVSMNEQVTTDEPIEEAEPRKRSHSTARVDIDIEKLQKMIDEGKSVMQMAEYFGVSSATISKRISAHGLRAK